MVTSLTTYINTRRVHRQVQTIQETTDEIAARVKAATAVKLALARIADEQQERVKELTEQLMIALAEIEHLKAQR